MNNEIEALKDRLLRITAEYENFRKRTQKEKEGIYTDATTDVIKEVLPVLDNLERALTVEGSIEDIKKGIEIGLRPKEYDLLYLLATNKGKVFSREQLLNRIWSYDYYGEVRNVDVHVRRLRAKIEDDENKYIETVFGVGYKLR